MFIYSLLILILLESGQQEWTVQHFDSPKECQVSSMVVIRAYAKEHGRGKVVASCIQGFKT